MTRYPVAAFLGNHGAKQKSKALQDRGLARAFASNQGIHARVEGDPQLREKGSYDVETEYTLFRCRWWGEGNTVWKNQGCF
jgi:hypothetical protein